MRVIVLVLLLMVCVLGSSWGPIAHETIAKEIASEAGITSPAFFAGAVMVDVALCKDSSDGIRQGKFHSTAYLDELKRLATTPEHKAFVQGCEVHLVSDGVQNEWNALLKPPISMDYGVDKLIGSTSIRISVSDSVATLMAVAWGNLYGLDIVTASWIKSAVTTYNLYLSGIYIPVDKALSQTWFSDYQTWLDKAVGASNALFVSQFAKGDVTEDGKVSILDALMIAQYRVGLVSLSIEQMVRADVSGDGQVTIVDAMFIAQYVAGLREI